MPPIRPPLIWAFLASAVTLCGCGSGGRQDAPPGDMAVVRDPNDQDGDGATPAQGDCDDSNPGIGPYALELPGNQIDDDCDGMVDEPLLPCDTGTLGQKGAAEMAAAIGFCDPRFVLDTELRGPSDARARDVVASFGKFDRLEGATMALISTGIAADKSSAAYVRPQDGTVLDQSNTVPNPDLTVPGVEGCGSSQPATVNDYTELKVHLRVPANVNALSFNLQFFSAEYPEYVCTAWNDEFLVEMESTKIGGGPHNISFDDHMNPLTINNGLFTICTNDASKPQTQHCTQSIDDLDGTGYEDLLAGRPIGGSTGWLRTTAPVLPGDEIWLRFIIFDEGDHIFDSAALIDNFAWSTDVITVPVTVP